jgi:hypothetical protein
MSDDNDAIRYRRYSVFNFAERVVLEKEAGNQPLGIPIAEGPP